MLPPRDAPQKKRPYKILIHHFFQAVFWRFFPDMLNSIVLGLFFKDFIYLFLGRGGGREKERERNIHVWEKPPLVALTHTPTSNQGHNLMCPDWNQTSNISLCGISPNQLSHISQGEQQCFHLKRILTSLPSEFYW